MLNIINYKKVEKRRNGDYYLLVKRIPFLKVKISKKEENYVVVAFLGLVCVKK